MSIFLTNYLWNLILILGLAGAGAFAIIPFARDFRFALLIAPLIGLFIIVLGVSTLYTILGLELRITAVIAMSICFCLTTFTLFYKSSTLHLSINLNLVIFILLFVAFITYITNYTSIHFGSDGFLYMEGSDHLGYATVSDWLNNHIANQKPISDPKYPYQSFPEIVFPDPRFGSFFTLALIATLRGESSMFAYDNTCALVLSIAILAVAAVFSRSRFTFILLCLGLLTSYWYVHSRQGYFAKTLAYPSTLMVIGLYLLTSRPFSILQITLLAIFTSAATIMLSHLSAGLFFAVLGGAFITVSAVNTLFQKQDQKNKLLLLKNDATLFAFLIFIIIATSGILAKPFYPILGNLPIDVDWKSLLLSMTDIQVLGFLYLSGQTLTGMITLFTCIGIIYFLIAYIKRIPIAISLLLSALLLFPVILIAGTKWQAAELFGTIYPWFLCAAILCMDNFIINYKTITIKNSFSFLSLFILFCIAVALHMPRFLTDIHRYAGSGIVSSQQFSKVELDHLADLIKNDTVTVDLDNVFQAFPILVELGRRDLSFQWTAKSWKAILGYRHWPAPKLDKPCRLWLTEKYSSIQKNCKIKYQTTQYNLLEC